MAAPTARCLSLAQTTSRYTPPPNPQSVRGDHVLLAHHLGAADEPLPHELGVLDQVHPSARSMFPRALVSAPRREPASHPPGPPRVPPSHLLLPLILY